MVRRDSGETRVERWILSLQQGNDVQSALIGQCQHGCGRLIPDLLAREVRNLGREIGVANNRFCFTSTTISNAGIFEFAKRSYTDVFTENRGETGCSVALTSTA